MNQGITDIVACPGARNAPLCHNFHQAGFTLHPVTDERSAAFVAIGIYLETRKPTIVCVTSGSALLNTLPAVAEAYYRHIPLIILSADRPEEWIGHLDGQTLPQNEALQPYTPSINIEESDDFHAINEGITQVLSAQGPSHINIQIEEPLFCFNQESLPEIKVNVANRSTEVFKVEESALQQVAEMIQNAKRPLLMMGQQEAFEPELFEKLSAHIALLPEIISNAKDADLSDKLEKILASGTTPSEMPDLILHIGGAFIGKQVKLHLRKLKGIKIIRIGTESPVAKTFGKVDIAIQADAIVFLKRLLPLLSPRNYHQEWKASVNKAFQELTLPPISNEEKAIIAFETALREVGIGALHVANSSSVRWANAHIQGGDYPVYCNRGVNGIEGSLSTAAGHSLKTEQIVGCIIGDLSFFYDANALWNVGLKENFIVLLLNNNRGKIFYKFNGLKNSPALAPFIAASHDATAEGICRSYVINHKQIHEAEEIKQFILEHINAQNTRPLVLEYICEKCP